MNINFTFRQNIVLTSITNGLNFFKDETEPSTLVLPNQWMWDIIDEFIYQFQSFCQYRAKIMNKPEEEMSSLKENVYKVNSIMKLTCSCIFNLTLDSVNSAWIKWFLHSLI